jgi:hypothetical protein
MTAATKNESTFRLEYAVAVSIHARPEDVWARLTNAAGFPSWNSTVTSIEGEIAQGQRLTIRVPIAPGRAFKPRVVSFDPGKRMVWSDGMAPMFKGERTFLLTPRPDGTTEFAMSETFAGLMLPMIKRSLPDFRPVFEQYATDLKRACEA